VVSIFCSSFFAGAARSSANRASGFDGRFDSLAVGGEGSTIRSAAVSRPLSTCTFSTCATGMTVFGVGLFASFGKTAGLGAATTGADIGATEAGRGGSDAGVSIWGGSNLAWLGVGEAGAEKEAAADQRAAR